MDHAGFVTRSDRRFALAVLVALSAFDCGGIPSDATSFSSAGTAEGGGSAGGASGESHGGGGGSAGSVASAGAATAAGAGGAGGKAGAAGSAGAAANSGAAGTAGGQSCGDRTCGANQYCRAPCSGTSLGGGQSLGDPTCAALPPTCNGVASCECICGSVGFFCTPGAFVVQCGCA